MTFSKRTAIFCLTWAAILCVGDLSADRAVVVAPEFVSPAIAKVGRPLTPVSVAGVARRTTRRCAAGVYNC